MKGDFMKKEMIFFYMPSCPHCKKADKLLEELFAEDPRFSDIEIKKIDEQKNSKLADSYDYYYVPCFWYGDRKLMEGVPSKEKVKSAIEFVLDN